MVNKIVVDLEATCCNNNEFMRHESEIIEIGACALDNDFNIISEFCEFIKPIKQPILTDFCTELTSITQEQVDSADYFPIVLSRFKEWLNEFETPVFNSWGYYDKKQLIRDCNFHGEEFPFGGYHTNLKKQFANRFGNGKPRYRGRQSYGLGTALKMAGLSFKGTHHRGIDDARNIARLVPHICPKI